MVLNGGSERHSANRGRDFRTGRIDLLTARFRFESLLRSQTHVARHRDAALGSHPSGSGDKPCKLRKTSITEMCSGRCSRYISALVAHESVSFALGGISPMVAGSSEATASSTCWNAARA